MRKRATVPRHPNRFQASLTRHQVTITIGEDVRYRIEQYRGRLVERFDQQGASDLTNLSFEEAVTDALDVGLEYDEALEGLVADVIDGHLFKAEKRKNRLREQVDSTGRCAPHGASVAALLELLSGLDPAATIVFGAGELRVTNPE